MKLATLCYVKHAGKTLMIHRVKKENDIHEGKWNGLGGKFQPGETPEECVFREVYEESGLIIHQPELRGIITFPNFARDEDWYAFVFVARQFEGELIDSAEGNLKWISDADILSLNLWEGDMFFLPYLDKAGFFSGKFVYQDGRLIEHSMLVYPVCDTPAADP
jgi:8-oxo-dGTP diphosphatase